MYAKPLVRSVPSATGLSICCTIHVTAGGFFDASPRNPICAAGGGEEFPGCFLFPSPCEVSQEAGGISVTITG